MSGRFPSLKKGGELPKIYSSTKIIYQLKTFIINGQISSYIKAIRNPVCIIRYFCYLKVDSKYDILS